jgi:hypothetical protein
MRSAFVLLLLSALVLAASAGVASAAACDGLGEAACKAAGCAWCLSAAVPASCYSAADAARLPPGVFDCSKKQDHQQQQSRLDVS